MALHTLPERVASPPLRARHARPTGWQEVLRAHGRSCGRDAKAGSPGVAGLIRRMQAGAGASGRETTHVDGLERR